MTQFNEGKGYKEIEQLKSLRKKCKLNKVSVIALSDWQLLRQVSKNTILHPIIY